MSDLPQDTETVQLLYKSITVNLDPDDVPEGVETEEHTHLRNSVLATFDEGDELPLEIAEQCWSGFSDRLAAFNADGDRLDAAAPAEQQSFNTALITHR